MLGKPMNPQETVLVHWVPREVTDIKLTLATFPVCDVIAEKPDSGGGESIGQMFFAMAVE